MILKNSLETPVFKDELDFKTLENILECLDHVIPKKVSRNEYNALKSDFLKETGEDKFGKRYDLFLPEDLVHGELLRLIDFLSKKFGLENYTPYSRIITQTKVLIGVILRGLGKEDGEKYLQNLAEKYSLSLEFIQKLQSQKNSGEKMNFTHAKEVIKSIKSRKKEYMNKKVGKNEDDIVLGLEKLKKLYGSEFYYLFLRKGINMLRIGMMTITQSEQKKLKEKGVGEGEVIEFHVPDDLLDEEEKLLRGKIGVDELKKELKKVRESGSQEKINETELVAINKIFTKIYEYPYQYTNNDYGYKPNEILKNKEMYCVGFSLLGYAFLSELGIRHSGLSSSGHIALEIHIGEKNYYFDPTGLNKIYEIENKGEININGFREITLKNVKLSEKLLVKKGNVERLLFSAIGQNIITGLH